MEQKGAEKMRDFHFDTITNSIQGAQPKEGDRIERVTFTDTRPKPIVFDQGWTVERRGGKFGIVWGKRQEFTPFECCAPAITFTLAQEGQA